MLPIKWEDNAVFITWLQNNVTHITLIRIFTQSEMASKISFCLTYFRERNDNCASLFLYMYCCQLKEEMLTLKRRAYWKSKIRSLWFDREKCKEAFPAESVFRAWLQALGNTPSSRSHRCFYIFIISPFWTKKSRPNCSVQKLKGEQCFVTSACTVLPWFGDYHSQNVREVQ